MSHTVRNFIKTYSQYTVTNNSIEEHYRVLSENLEDDLFIHVIGIVDEKDALVARAARNNYRQGLSDGAYLARLLKMDK